MPYSKKSGFKGLRVLVTSGPTSVPIDDMRVITNRSTGEMGRLITQAFSAQGACVTLLEGAVAVSAPTGKIRLKKFFEFNELAQALKDELAKGYAIVVHAAAVSDFELARPFHGKIASGRPLTIRLKPTKKLVNDIKRLSPQSILVAFKLESALHGSGPKACRLLKDAEADLLVANRCGKFDYEAFIMRSDGTVTPNVKSKKELVSVMIREIGKLLKAKHCL